MTDTTDNSKKIENRIVRAQGICGGEAVSKGTRVILRAAHCIGVNPGAHYRI